MGFRGGWGFRVSRAARGFRIEHVTSKHHIRMGTPKRDPVVEQLSTYFDANLRNRALAKL